MEERYGTVKAFLQYYDRPLVNHAVERANLTVPEWQAIKLREYEKKTVSSAAEYLLVSDKTVQNRYNAGMEKLDNCWNGLPWVNSLIYHSNIKQ